MRRELTVDLWTAVRTRQPVAARDVDLVGQHQGDGVAGLGGLDLAVGDQKAGDRALTPRVRGDDAIAASDASGGNRAGKAAKILVRPVDPLHRQPEGRASAILFDLGASQLFEKMWAGVPGRAGAQR